jgi:hypothetical protein
MLPLEVHRAVKSNAGRPYEDTVSYDPDFSNRLVQRLRRSTNLGACHLGSAYPEAGRKRDSSIAIGKLQSRSWSALTGAPPAIITTDSTF